MTQRLYSELAPWWPLLSDRDTLAEEAEHLIALFDEAHGSPIGSLLELGSGGGGLASHVDPDREVILTDLSAEMLAVCKANNPTRDCIAGDMRTLRLNRRFEAVLIHDAVMYLTSEADLQAAFNTAAAHLAVGGVLLVVPDVVHENFQERAVSGGSVGRPGVQIMEWHWDPDPTDTTHRLDVSVLYRDDSGAMKSMHESHTLGLFPTSTFIRCLINAGLTPIDGLIWDETLMPEVFGAQKR